MMFSRHRIYHDLARFHLVLRRDAEAVTAFREAPAINQVRKIIKRVPEFDPNVTQQLIRETGRLPEGVQRR